MLDTFLAKLIGAEYQSLATEICSDPGSCTAEGYDLPGP
jgi:hypothetical protein